MRALTRALVVLVLVPAGVVITAGGLSATLGPWPAALVLTPALTALILAGWSSAERRLFPPAAELPATRVSIGRTPSAQLDEARALALAQLADLYLDHQRARAREAAHR